MTELPVNRSMLALRKKICAGCEWRRSGDTARSCEEALACEQLCALFVHLPQLIYLVARFGSEPPCGYDNVIDSFLRNARQRSASPSAESEEALRAYGSDALAVIECIAATCLKRE